MAEKPILFNTEMVRAILDGRKTQTRRLCKGQSQDGVTSPVEMGYEPPYRPGDVLYVRETWADIPETAPGNLHYRADATQADLDWFREKGWKWRPSIHMPKGAARIFLKVKNVRAERLQQIDTAGCIAEGAVNPAVSAAGNVQPGYARLCMEGLWNSTVRKDDLERYGWAANPWVWVIEFERCEKP